VTPAQYSIRPVEPGEEAALFALIVGLAEYENLAHMVVATPPDLADALFGEKARVEAVLVRVDNHPEPVGFALYYHNFSTFLGRAGLYLEDLFVLPAFRGQGLGRALLIHLARLAVSRNCGRFEWSVLDWNTSAQGFYESLGARVLPDWRITRVTGAALTALAALP
jgi:GNAT superfamily N-acetyltransferase